jgi:nucleoside-diphosphate-sugar epimerase
MAKLIFGCGYLGERVAKLWSDGGGDVLAVTRTVERGRELAQGYALPIIGDVVARMQLPLPQGIRTVLFAIGNDGNRGRSVHEVFVGGLSHALASLSPNVERFIFISSTGVYGQVDGETVDEDSPCHPLRESGRACLAAEEALRRSSFAKKAIILRMAGIYGPGRIPRAPDLIDNKPIDAPANGWLNLIHVDDAARLIALAARKLAPPRTFVVSDGRPVERKEYYAELARLLGAPPPRFVESPSPSPAAARASSDKRVNPRRIMEALHPELLYPSYREGLAAILKAERPDQTMLDEPTVS